MRRRLFIACYATSGAAALVYQVALVRLFTLTLGHSVAASSTVLAAFMGGLALGAWVAGRFPTDGTRSLRLYAALEIFIAATAIAMPFLLSGFEPVMALSYADGNTPIRFAIVRVAVSLALLGLPAAAMGATFPLAVAWLARLERPDVHDASLRAAIEGGVLYAVNTAGAAVGAVAAGFWFIPVLGIRGTTWAAVALNVASASGALWLSRIPPQKTVIAASTPRGRRLPAVQRTARRAPRPFLASGAAALSGFAALVYEVTWTRLLALIVGPTTYAFAIMTASFISGIALGSGIGVRLARRSSEPASWLAAMLIVTAVSTLAAAWFTSSRLPLVIAAQVAAATAFGPLLLKEALTIVLVLMPASISLGATFTLALAAAAPDIGAAARETARVYVANTIGAVAGALAAGFVFVPEFGLQATFVHTSRALVVAGVVIAAAAADSVGGRPYRRALPGLLAGALVLVASFGVPEWDRDLLASGAYKYSRNLDSQMLDASLRAGQLEYYREGAAGTVSVRQMAGSLAMAIDGKVDASNAGDMLTQRLLGLLPTLLHPHPREALVIGLGSGVTLDAVTASGDVQHADVVEISPEVVEASALFERENRGVLKRPGVRLLMGDGRSHLQLATRQYDVIVSEPSNPWMAGVAALFTREFFEAARARLRPGGVFCQWAHTYEIAEDDLQSIVRTFVSLFPDGTLWLVGDGDLLLIGTAAGDVQSRVAGILERWRKGSVPALLADVAVTPQAAPFVLLSLFAGGPADLVAYGNGAAVQTDDRMSLEFTAARAMNEPPGGNAARLRALRARAGPPAVVVEAMKSATVTDWTARGLVSLQAAALDMARESFRNALALDSRSVEALRGWSDAATGTQNLAEEIDWLKAQAAAEPDNAPVRVELSHVLAAVGNTDGAIAAAVEAERIDPTGAEPLEQLASVLADSGDGARLAPIAAELVRRFPARDEGHYFRAVALFLGGRAADAEAAAVAINELLARNPRHAKGQNLRGVICAARGDHKCAQSAFETSMQLNPKDPAVYVNLGYLHLEEGDPAMAVESFSEAFVIDPTAESARKGLTDARAALSQR